MRKFLSTGLSTVKEYFLRAFLRERESKKKKNAQKEVSGEGGRDAINHFRAVILFVFHLRSDPLRASQLLISVNKMGRYVVLQFRR